MGIRLTKPADRHPRDENPSDMLRRHFALVKALLIIAIGGAIVWFISMAALVVLFEDVLGKNLGAGGFTGIVCLLIAFYMVRLFGAWVLPIEY